MRYSVQPRDGIFVKGYRVLSFAKQGRYFCIGFIDFMLKGKILSDYANLFCPNEYENNDKTILTYFQ